MENTRVKKIVILVAALLTLTIVGLQFGLSNFMQASAEPNQDVKVEYSTQVNEEKTEEQIQINATPKEPEVTITSIELPNGEVVNDTAATYTATENGKLTFTINYKFPKASSEQPFIEKEPEYEEKQQTTTYQVTGIKSTKEQQEQTPTQSSPESSLSSTLETSPNSAPENNLASSPNITNPSSEQPPFTNGALQQNNLGDTPTAYTPENAFTIDGNGTITAYNVSIGGTDVVIPPIIKGIPVKSTNNFVFGNKGLTSVSLPEGLQTIRYAAFTGNQLTSVTIPSTVTSIETEAFSNNQLTEVTLPEGLQSIGNNAFYNNQLTRVTIPSTVTSIGTYAFDRNRLTEIILQEGLHIIENNAFSSNQLTSVTIPSTVTNIGSGAFYGNQLKQVTLPEGLQSIGDYAFQNNQLISVTISSTVASIGAYAFNDNQLTQVTLQEGLQTIGDWAFSDNKLTGNMTIPSTVTSIGVKAFFVNQLTQVTLQEGLQSIGDYAFSKTSVCFLDIPESVTKLGKGILDQNAFSGLAYKGTGVPNRYEVNLKEQIPGFNPADYIYSTDTGFFKNMKNYSYDRTTGIFVFEANKDITKDNTQFALVLLNLGNNHITGASTTLLFNKLEPYRNVTLNLQGGQFTDPNFNGVLSVPPNKAIGQEIGANEIAYPGFNFLGWYTDAACTQPFDMMTDIVTDDMTLYAKWQWNETQPPNILIKIPSTIKLSEYPAEQMAKGSITLSVIYNQFNPNKNIIINTQRNPLMERVNHTDSIQLEVLKPDGTKYTDSDPALMILNNYNNGYPQSATFTVQTPLSAPKLLGTYTGNLTYEISME